ncbi:copper chaperone PCu(A)C [Streptomyces sp. NPDC058200]|uniref:copper chaperone PCu(A)C n=1 Tax=Streptomyces sp. NPDC058200 TaxID=3346378 RepID=UPI0036E6E78C
MKLPSTARAALAPLATACVALAGLTAWVTAGGAGYPAHIEAGPARVFLPLSETRTQTAAFLTLTNSGRGDDVLTRVTSPFGEAMLMKHVTRDGASRMRDVSSLRVPAGQTVRMTPYDTNIVLELNRGVRQGQRVPIVLHFRSSAPVRVTAQVIRPAEYGRS